MDEMLREIVETDKASRLDVQKAMQRREQLSEEIAEKKKEAEEKYKQTARRKIEKARNAAQDEIARAEKETDARVEEKSRALTDAYEKKHNEWEDAVFAAVTGE